MSCEFGHTDCKNEDKRCDLCVNELHYAPKQQKVNTLKKRRLDKPTGRKGEYFERKNNKNLQNTVNSVVTNMTPNSGAGNVKGDQQIRGILNVMEELKTQDPHRARGHSQFTIQKKWLDKLDREAPLENMEFWYLKFAFKDTDDQHYVVIDAALMSDMVATIIHDRKKANEADERISIADKRRVFAEAETSKYVAENEYLKALLDKAGIPYDKR